MVGLVVVKCMVRACEMNGSEKLMGHAKELESEDMVLMVTQKTRLF